MSESQLREDICSIGQKLFGCGLVHGATGNISVRLDDGCFLMTPTNVALGELDPAELTKLDAEGHVLGGKTPTKESFLHLSVYGARNGARAVVHLHCTHAAAVSCLDGLDHENCLPPLTAYHVMRVGPLPLVPYFPPGDRELARAVGERASRHHAMLLANHGPVVAGTTLRNAAFAIEELEQTARIFLLTRGLPTRPLDEDAVKRLEQLGLLTW